MIKILAMSFSMLSIEYDELKTEHNFLNDITTQMYLSPQKVHK
jgi:hypothetical protein